jgi:hypothetical protein
MKKILILTLGTLLLTGCTEVAESEISINEVEPVTVQSIKIETETPIPLTQEESNYIVNLSKAVETYSSEVAEIQRLTNVADGSTEWLQELKGNFLTIKFLNVVLLDMSNAGDVPVRFTELHSQTIECFGLMSQAGDKIIEGSTGVINESLLNEGVVLINESNLYLNEVAKGINELSID